MDINANRSPELEPVAPHVEQPEILELSPEKDFDKSAKLRIEDKVNPSQVVIQPEVSVSSQTASVPAIQKQVEGILAEGLESVYKNLSPDKKLQFKVLGEQTARKIVGLVSQTKFRLVEVLKLIRDWLFTLPGVNKFFVEQEAKIKLDKILKLRK
ncbi:MAG: hypothetical protein AAB657_02310 [Patescibacteria group bacterium]|mgnify:CR=1 FL=1